MVTYHVCVFGLEQNTALSRGKTCMRGVSGALVWTCTNLLMDSDSTIPQASRYPHQQHISSSSRHEGEMQLNDALVALPVTANFLPSHFW